MDRFAEIRNVLSNGPSEANWRELLKHLRAWPQKEQREMAIQYIDAHLATWPDHLRALSELADSPYWRFIRCYELRSNIKKSTLKSKLLHSTFMPHLTAFKWNTGGPIDDVLLTLLTSENCRNIKDIRLERCFLDYGFAQNSQYVGYYKHCRLEHFSLMNAGDGDNNWTFLLQLLPFSRLKSLALSLHKLRFPTFTMSAFSELPCRETLETLSVEQCFSPTPFYELPVFPALKTLSFARNWTIRPEHWVELASWSTLEGLKTLDLRQTRIEIQAVQALLESRYAHEGLTIDLRQTKVTKQELEGLQRFGKGEGLPTLLLDSPAVQKES